MTIEFADRLNRAVTLRVLAANGVGVIVAFVYISVVAVGNTGLRTAGDALSASLVVVYLAVVVPLALVKARRATEPVRCWLAETRPPTAAEREHALRLPAVLAGSMWGRWVGAAVLFAALNALVLGAPWARTAQIGATVALAGLITSAIAYLLIERLSRPIFALALATATPTRPATMGIRARLLLAWVLGSGVIFFGIVLAPLGGAPGSHPDITLPAIFLALLGIVAGAVLTSAVARSIAEPLEVLREGLQRVKEGDLDVAVTVDDGGELGLLQAGFNTMVAGLGERQRLRDLFGRHVGREVARQALEQGAGLGGEIREVSALFVDLTGSTAMAQEYSPAQVVGMLNAFFSAVVRVAAEEGGWVNKFEGDAALCVFGAPGAQADHAARALRAARALHVELTRLSGMPARLDAGIGVASGEAVAGNVGAEERYEYTVIGDPVNEASRLTELAKTQPGRVLANERAVQTSGEEAAAWDVLGEMQLRGRASPTRVYAPKEVTG